MDKNFENFGLGILGSFFGIYDEKALEQGKLLIGKYVVEHGGAEQVFGDNFKSVPIDTPKEKIIEALNECKDLYQNEHYRDKDGKMMETDKPRPADYARQWNEDIEKERLEYHRRKCEESDGHRQAYEELNNLNRKWSEPSREFLEAAITGKPVKHEENPQETNADNYLKMIPHSGNPLNDALSAAFIRWMCMSSKQREQFMRKQQLIGEIMKADKEFEQRKVDFALI